MFKALLQYLAFFFPSPVNLWLHRLSGAAVASGVRIHPFVLLRAKHVSIDRKARIKMGTMIDVHSFRLGQKSSIGFFTLVKGESDLLIGDACLIGPRSTIDCTRTVRMGYYASLGPRSVLYTHGSFLPVTWGYPAKFEEVEIGDQVWISMNVTIGPGVRVGRGSLILPGTVLLEEIPEDRMVMGASPNLKMLPLGLVYTKPEEFETLARDMLSNFCGWATQTEQAKVRIDGVVAYVRMGRRTRSVALRAPADILLFLSPGEKRTAHYFNLRDLTTDPRSCPEKELLERYMRMYYGLIFRDDDTISSQ